MIVKLHFSSSSDIGGVWSEILLVPASWAADTDGEAASSSWQRGTVALELSAGGLSASSCLS